MDTVLQVLSDEPVPPRRLNPSIPRDVETICLKCLEKEPARRYGSALRHSWPGPAPIPGRRADRGAAGDAAGAGGEVGAAEADAGRGLHTRPAGGGARRPGGCGRMAVAGRGTARDAARSAQGEAERQRDLADIARSEADTARDAEKTARADAERQRAIRAVRIRSDHPGRPPGVAGEQYPFRGDPARGHPSRPPRLGVAIRPSPLPFRFAHAQGSYYHRVIRVVQPRRLAHRHRE